MDIACPHCAATYRVPDSLLATGKPLRCAACGREWTPAERPAAPAPMPVPSPTPVTPPARVPAARVPVPALAEAPPPPGTGLLPAAWIVSIAAVLLGLAMLYLYHEPLAAAWPPLQRLF